jgi:hypothetical protein
MASVTNAPAAPVAPDTEERRLRGAELRWNIRVAQVDIVQKILISIIGAFIVAIFYAYQADQTQSRYDSDLRAQRERADADLRANMFKTLFEAYFKNKIDAAQKLAASSGDSQARSAALLANLGQEIMLSDLLARNFETVDVRPLFEDLDRRLTELIERGGEGQKTQPQQAEAFRQREQLRRVAYGATARQIESLRAIAGAEVRTLRIQQCQVDPSSRPVIDPQELQTLPGKTTALVRQVADGSVTLALIAPGDRTQEPVVSQDGVIDLPPPREVPITVTYFDMPTLENVRLADGRRMAMTLTRSASTQSCERFSAQMDENTRRDCELQPNDSRKQAGACSWASVSITLIPKDYIGMRDRPFLSDMPTGSDPIKNLIKLLRSQESTLTSN